MIKEISIENFKSFKKLEKLQIKPITILVGKNSCGKSSILQSLLLLKQSLDTHYENNTLELEGEYLQYSNLKEISFGQPRITSASIGYKFKLKDIDEKDILLELDFKHKSNKEIITSKCKITKEGFEFDYANPTKKKLKELAGEYILDIIKNSKVGKVKYNHFIPKFVFLDLEEKDNKDNKKNFRKDFPLPFEILNFEMRQENYLAKFEEIIKSIKYLSPVRAYPRRAYVHFSEAETELSSDGTNSAHILWLNKDKKIEFKDSSNKTLLASVNDCLKTMNLKQKITPSKLGDIVYKLNLEELNTNSKVSIADVGFGYSQVLPIILTGLLAKNDNLILIEQPEIHLHPSSAANLGDLFLDFIQNNDKKFIIETHSQELINRLRLRVIKNPELSKLINIVFVEENDIDTEIEDELDLSEFGIEIKNEENKDIGSKIRQFSIDSNGNFPVWPEGFLDESEKIAKQIIDARIKSKNNG